MLSNKPSFELNLFSYTLSSTVVFKVKDKQLNGVRLIQSIELDRLEKALNYKLLPVIIELKPTVENGFIREWQPYYGSIDKHNAYALQWFAMASILLFLFIKAWETRLSDGFSALVASAINGKGGMPARGGNPDNTDSEMELAVSHMMKEAGIELVAKSSVQTTSAPATEEKPAMAVKAEEAVQVEAPETKAQEETAAEKEEMKAEVKEVMTESKEVVAKTEEVKTETVASVATAKTVVDHSAGLVPKK